MKNFKGGSGGFGGGGKRFGGGGNQNREHTGHGKFGGGRSNDFHGGHNKGGRSFDKPQLFSAVCSTCGKGCEVPFRPSDDKPVYCSACFGKKNQDMNREFRGERQEPEFKRDARPMCEEKGARSEHDGRHEALKQQLVTLEFKVNRILELLNPHTKENDAEVEASETPKKVGKPKTEKVKAPVKKKVAKKVKK